MNSLFEKLITEFQDARRENDEEKQERILQQMRESLLNLFNIIKEDIKNQIRSASYQELLEIHRSLQRIKSSVSFTQISDMQRDKQMKNNKYGPDNPYNGQ
ncbi:MAG: hypothetical protein J5719_06325 [Bacteroidales bacterium]|nr:hypothetical protein [Bacteroidales bacterium]